MTALPPPPFHWPRDKLWPGFDNHTFSEDALFLLGMSAWPQNLKTDMHPHTSFPSLAYQQEPLTFGLDSKPCILFAIREYFGHMGFFFLFWVLLHVYYIFLKCGSEIFSSSKKRSLLGNTETFFPEPYSLGSNLGLTAWHWFNTHYKNLKPWGILWSELLNCPQLELE